MRVLRVSNGNERITSVKIGQNQRMEDQYPDNKEKGEDKRIAGNESGGVSIGGGVGRFYGWPSSRIVRVTRASGGKDRHSKVLTSKGLRDRRVRLSVNTAFQFYDLQDRLGYDQPSKAVEWLLKAAASSISELPPMSSPFPDTPKQLSDDKRSSTGGNDLLGLDTAEVEMDGCDGYPSCIKRPNVTKSSACSSNSENSKGSGLSLSRSENRIMARVRAKERFAEKEKDQNESSYIPSLNPICQTSSFTELLNGGFSNSISPDGSVHQTPPNRGSINVPAFFEKSPRHNWSSSTSMDYFTSGLLTQVETRPGQMQFQTLDFTPDSVVSVGGNSNRGDNHHKGSREYNLNFTISSSGFNRGTLQSNSSSPTLLPHLQRFPPTDASQTGFLVGAAVPVEYHHQFLPGFDSRLQLFYADSQTNNGRHTAQKGEGKNGVFHDFH